MVQAFLKANLNHLCQLSATCLCSCIVINFAPMVHMDHFLSFSLYRRMKLLNNVNNVTKKPELCEHAKTKAQISSAVIARLRSAFVFAAYSLHPAATISSLQLPFMARTDRFLSNLIGNPKDRFFLLRGSCILVYTEIHK